MLQFYAIYPRNPWCPTLQRFHLVLNKNEGGGEPKIGSHGVSQRRAIPLMVRIGCPISVTGSPPSQLPSHPL